MPRFVLIIAAALLLANATHAGQIRGRVVGGAVPFEKEPIAGAVVQIVCTAMGAGTNLNGDFTILGVPTGTVTLRASSLGYQSDTLTVVVEANTAAQHDVEIVLPYDWCFWLEFPEYRERQVRSRADSVQGPPSPGGAWLRGKILDRGNGRPIPRAGISASYELGADTATRRVGCCAGSRTDTSGRYTLNYQPPGRYALHACAPGYLASEERMIEMKPDSLYIVDFALTRKARVK